MKYLLPEVKTIWLFKSFSFNLSFKSSSDRRSLLKVHFLAFYCFTLSSSAERRADVQTLLFFQHILVKMHLKYLLLWFVLNSCETAVWDIKRKELTSLFRPSEKFGTHSISWAMFLQTVRLSSAGLTSPEHTDQPTIINMWAEII